MTYYEVNPTRIINLEEVQEMFLSTYDSRRVRVTIQYKNGIKTHIKSCPYDRRISINSSDFINEALKSNDTQLVDLVNTFLEIKAILGVI